MKLYYFNELDTKAQSFAVLEYIKDGDGETSFQDAKRILRTDLTTDRYTKQGLYVDEDSLDRIKIEIKLKCFCADCGTNNALLDCEVRGKDMYLCQDCIGVRGQEVDFVDDGTFLDSKLDMI